MDDLAATQPRGLTSAVSFAVILAPLNATMIVVVLPEVRSQFSVSYSHVTWLTSAYLAAMVLFQPIGGRLGDRLGNARMLKYGLWLLVFLSLACALSPSFDLLLALRVAQALAGAAVIPNGLAILRRSLPASRLGKAMGIVGAAIGSAAVVGPLLASGLLLISDSWRLIFVASVVFGLIALRRSSSLAVAAPVEGGVTESPQTPFFSWGVVRSRSFLAPAMFGLLSNAILYTILLAVPFFVTQLHSGKSAEAGGLLGVMSLLALLLAPFSGRISDAIGRRSPALAGAGLQVLGVVTLLLVVRTNQGSLALMLPMALLGLGIGLGTAPATTASLEAAPEAMAGIAAGMSSTMRYAGGLLGSAVLGASVASSHFSDSARLSHALLAAVVFALVLLPCAAFMRSEKREATTGPLEQATETA